MTQDYIITQYDLATKTTDCYAFAKTKEKALQEFMDARTDAGKETFLIHNCRLLAETYSDGGVARTAYYSGATKLVPVRAWPDEPLRPPENSKDWFWWIILGAILSVAVWESLTP